MSGFVYTFRLLINVPPPVMPGPIRSQPRVQDNMRLSQESSDIIRNAQNSNFPDCMSAEAFYRDLRVYGELYGERESDLMQDRFELLNISPSTYLRHIYRIVNILQINPSLQVLNKDDCSY